MNRPSSADAMWVALFNLLGLGNSVFFIPDGGMFVRSSHVRQHIPADMIEALGEPQLIARPPGLRRCDRVFLSRRRKELAIACYPCYHADVIVDFKDAGIEDVFNGKNTRAARKACPTSAWRVAQRKLDHLDSVVQLDEIKVPPGNRLETLSGDRRGQYSIRINDQYRICFVWTEAGPVDVEIIDYH